MVLGVTDGMKSEVVAGNMGSIDIEGRRFDMSTKQRNEVVIYVLRSGEGVSRGNRNIKAISNSDNISEALCMGVFRIIEKIVESESVNFQKPGKMARVLDDGIESVFGDKAYDEVVELRDKNMVELFFATGMLDCFDEPASIIEVWNEIKSESLSLGGIDILRVFKKLGFNDKDVEDLAQIFSDEKNAQLEDEYLER